MLVPGTPWMPGVIAGWHDFFDALRDHLTGIPIGSLLLPSEFGEIARYWIHEHRRAASSPPNRRSVTRACCASTRTTARWSSSIASSSVTIARPPDLVPELSRTRWSGAAGQFESDRGGSKSQPLLIGTAAFQRSSRRGSSPRDRRVEAFCNQWRSGRRI